MSTNKDLYDFCRWNETEQVKQILNNFNDIDVLYEEGSFFSFAISKNNTEICSALLKYFNEVQFPIKENNYEYQLHKNKLYKVLQEAVDMYEFSEEMKQVLLPYIKFGDSENESSKKLDFQEEDIQNHSGESTQVTLEDEHSLLSESYLSKYNKENSLKIKDLKVYQAIKSLQSVYSHENDELASNIARDFGMHAGDGNATHVRIWQKGEQKIIDIDSSLSAELKGVQLSLHSVIRDIITMPEAMDCHIEGCHQLHEEHHVNLSGCEYEYMGEGF